MLDTSMTLNNGYACHECGAKSSHLVHGPVNLKRLMSTCDVYNDKYAIPIIISPSKVG